MCMQIGKNTEHWFTDFIKYMCGKYCACFKKKKKGLYKNVITPGVFFAYKPLTFQYGIASNG